MILRRNLILFICILSLSMADAQSIDVDRQLNYCHGQVKKALAQLKGLDGSYNYGLEPRNILKTDVRKGWNCLPAKAEEWCSGFWPGILWMDYAYSKDSSVLQAARGYTESLQGIAWHPVYDHDIGFLIFCSFGKGYQMTRSEVYRKVILASADSLATLFNPLVGTILSWPREVKSSHWPHNTIIDNMMNLEILFWAARNGGNRLLYDLAVMHAKTTMNHQFRPDGSCYHVAVYDTINCDFIKGVTHQGYSDSSMWSRGQAWAIYGYTMVYRYTHQKVFLDFAQKVADVYLRRLHETSQDWIPRWDMDDPSPSASKDASAACVVADALLELQGYVGGEKGRQYREDAVRMLTDLSSERYQSRKKNVAFLMHSTGHHPAGSEIDASIIYADYYYLEALLRLKTLN